MRLLRRTTRRRPGARRRPAAAQAVRRRAPRRATREYRAIPTSTNEGTRGYAPRIRSRHPSHNSLRPTRRNNRRGINKPLGGFRRTCVIRFGSETPSDATIEINSIQSVRNSSSKLRMKRCFFRNQVTTAEAFEYLRRGTRYAEFTNMRTGQRVRSCDLPFPIIAKPFNSSRGRGIELIGSEREFEAFQRRHTASNYLFEQYLNYSREYRLHVTAIHGCFYTNRKMLRNDAPDDRRFIRNDSNCVWYLESNPAFRKPRNWGEIVDMCVNALNSVELDIGAVDLRTTTPDENGDVRFAVIEINSAPSFGDGTQEMYKRVLPDLINYKIDNHRYN